MKSPRLAGRRRPAVIAISAVAAVATALAMTTAGSAQAEQQKFAEAAKLYIVQVAGDPVASYDGDVAGFAATRPAQGKKIDTDSAAVRAYRSYLNSKHRDVLNTSRVAESKKIRDLDIAFNGFTARLTGAEATRLAHTTGVARVWENEIVSVDTISTPSFLGLTGGNGVWARQFGGAARAGEGVIVGVIDSGFWPENPSFAPLPEPRPDAATIAAKWSGECDAGDEAPLVTCNNKVLGARWYNETGLAQDLEFLSPRDFNGHGSHTSSTAAGNNNVPAAIFGAAVGNVSGMAPAAHLAIYKVLWHNPAANNASGGTVDIVSAIDQAVADGVDVINYSISGSTTSVIDPVTIGFFNAAASGVFVAASAGNNGPAASTVAHNSPWLTTVAASTHDRNAVKTVTLGNANSFNGVGVGSAVGPAPLIDSTAAGLPGADPTALRLCFSDVDGNPLNGVTPVLDPAQVTGKIVICERGVNARVDKSFAVQQAGGIGMILYNPSLNSLNADFHAVPTIHVDTASGTAIKAYATSDPAPTATISAGTPITDRAPAMAAFSSLGPARAGGGDLLKPDITAPGVDVIAAVAPPGNHDNNFDAFSGTSMSSPHIAGLAALLRGAHPDWSPMWIKSALMTNAGQTDNTGQPIQRGAGNATPLDFGSGHARPGPAFDPGLVYGSDVPDWLRYGCAINQFQLVTPPGFCTSLGAVDPSNVNYPSIAVGDLAGSQVVSRTVTNVTNRSSRYDVSVEAPPGFTVAVSPTSMIVPAHHSRSFTVTITRTTAPLGQYRFGAITWTDKDSKRGHVVRSPIAVRPVAIAAPAEAVFAGSTGAVTAKMGYTGTLNTSAIGLVGATVSDFNLDTNGPDFNPNAPAAGAQVGLVTAAIPAGTSFARFATFDADYPANTDVDLWVYRLTGGTPPRVLVAFSAGATADESVTLNNPLAATYEVYVDLFAAASGTTETVHHNHWVVPTTPSSNLTVTPASQSVTTGATATVNLTASGLTAGVRYLGALSYSDGTSTIGRTIVRFDA